MANETFLAKLVDPQVLGEMVSAKLGEKLTFRDLMSVDFSLNGVAGSVLTIPRYDYVGEAVVVAEGDAIPVTEMSTQTEQHTILKIAKSIAVTDEAVLSAYGDPLGQIVHQLTLAIADKLNKQALTAFLSTKRKFDAQDKEMSSDLLADALVLFGEDLGERTVLVVSPAQLAQLRKNSDWISYTDTGVGELHSGYMGSIWGSEVQVSATLHGTQQAIIAKESAVKYLLKRDVLVEYVRNAGVSTQVVATMHGLPYLAYGDRVILIENINKDNEPAVKPAPLMANLEVEEPVMTKADYQAKLDELGVKYTKRDNLATLQGLYEDAVSNKGEEGISNGENPEDNPAE